MNLDGCGGDVDRRSDRRNVPEEAIERYLGALAQRLGASAMVLADGDGRVACAGGAGIPLARLGELGVASACGAPEAMGALERLAGDEDLYTHAWSAGGTSFRLISLRARVPRVREVASTVQRIRDAMY